MFRGALIRTNSVVLIGAILFSDSSPGHASDDCFLVERYESDVEDEDEEGQVILTLSDRFLKEKSTNGEVCVLCGWG